MTADRDRMVKLALPTPADIDWLSKRARVIDLRLRQAIEAEPDVESLQGRLECGFADVLSRLNEVCGLIGDSSYSKDIVGIVQMSQRLSSQLETCGQRLAALDVTRKALCGRKVSPCRDVRPLHKRLVALESDVTDRIGQLDAELARVGTLRLTEISRAVDAIAAGRAVKRSNRDRWEYVKSAGARVSQLVDEFADLQPVFEMIDRRRPALEGLDGRIAQLDTELRAEREELEPIFRALDVYETSAAAARADIQRITASLMAPAPPIERLVAAQDLADLDTVAAVGVRWTRVVGMFKEVGQEPVTTLPVAELSRELSDLKRLVEATAAEARAQLASEGRSVMAALEADFRALQADVRANLGGSVRRLEERYDVLDDRISALSDVLATPVPSFRAETQDMLQIARAEVTRVGFTGVAYSDAAISPVVVDSGTLTTRAGLAGDERPRSVFPTPGDDVEGLYRRVFAVELHVDPTEHPVLVTQTAGALNRDRERLMEVMFETFHVPAFYVACEQSLALYASGLTTGVVLGAGHGATQVVPVYEGTAMPHAFMRVGVAGADLDAWLAAHLAGAPASDSERRDIKEKLCYVALDFDQENRKGDPGIRYTIEGARTVLVAAERFKCPELLFRPEPNGDGIHQAVFNAITKCDRKIRRDLYANIVLTGGTSMFTGLPERLEKEMGKLAPGTMRVKIVAPQLRELTPWIGGSVLAGHPAFPQMVVPREAYSELGVGIVHRRCL
jgi:actin